MNIFSQFNDLAFITNLRGSQLIIILLVILLLFGSKKLPELARGIGKAIREFRKSTSEVEKDIRSAMEDDPIPAPQAASESTTPESPKTPEA